MRHTYRKYWNPGRVRFYPELKDDIGPPKDPEDILEGIILIEDGIILTEDGYILRESDYDGSSTIGIGSMIIGNTFEVR